MKISQQNSSSVHVLRNEFDYHCDCNDIRSWKLTIVFAMIRESCEDMFFLHHLSALYTGTKSVKKDWLDVIYWSIALKQDFKLLLSRRIRQYPFLRKEFFMQFFHPLYAMVYAQILGIFCRIGYKCNKSYKWPCITNVLV